MTEDLATGAGPRLWSANFRNYFAARTISLLGDIILPIGLIAAVLGEGYGASGVGYALAASLGPTIVLMLFGGALADHFRPKPLLVLADLVRLAAQGWLAVSLLTGSPSLAEILITQAVFGTATALFQPSISGIVPEVAPGRVHEANAALRITESCVTLGGPALAGVLLVVAGPPVVMVFVTATCLISCLLVWTLRLSGAAAAGRPRVLKDIREGWTAFASRPWLWSVICVFVVLGLTVFGPYHVLSATVLTEDRGASAYALLMSAHGAGAIAGGFLALKRMPKRPLLTGALWLALFIPQFLFIALKAPVVLVAAAMFAAGVGRSYWAVMWSTSVQTQVPPKVLNRVLAYEITGSMMLVPVGRALSGPVAETAGSAPVLLASAAVLTLGCLALVAIPAVRGLRPVSPTPAGTS
ncbi:MFS transporter [Nonomuraea sp. NPDC059023]|uniref:MFS transporter n=1 Tax=unclassified Nonomuraea TaxID=2593643 RepID=UPI0036919A22